MAENKQDKQHDEYEFADFDSLGSEPLEEEELSTKSDKENASKRWAYLEQKDIRRNALIVIGIVLAIMLVYKLGSYFFSSSSKPAQDALKPLPPAVSPPKPITPQPIVSVVNQTSLQLEKKFAAMEINQENLRNQLNETTNQVQTLSNAINQLNTKIMELNQVVANLSTKLEEQSVKISSLFTIKIQKRPLLPPSPRVIIPRVVYYIQAIIPGRAWLVSSNGAVLTVREGSSIAGYGVVKMIDANQGRVLMTSGRVIRFSQQDS